jgi:hypothetical protein
MVWNIFSRNRKRAVNGMMASKKTNEIDEETVTQSSSIKLLPAVAKALK